MVMSTYRQSSLTSPPVRDADPYTGGRFLRRILPDGTGAGQRLKKPPWRFVCLFDWRAKV
ncbi:MAG: hypothetical protein U0936_02105 [Planctomycetaceae bacterium]